VNYSSGYALQFEAYINVLNFTFYTGSNITLFTLTLIIKRPSLWSSGQRSWLQIRRPGFDSRHYQKKKVVGLERGPLSLGSTTEEILD
jgi:hypothetical protein